MRPKLCYNLTNHAPSQYTLLGAGTGRYKSLRSALEKVMHKKELQRGGVDRRDVISTATAYALLPLIYILYFHSSAMGRNVVGYWYFGGGGGGGPQDATDPILCCFGGFTDAPVNLFYQIKPNSIHASSHFFPPTSSEQTYHKHGSAQKEEIKR